MGHNEIRSPEKRCNRLSFIISPQVIKMWTPKNKIGRLTEKEKPKHNNVSRSCFWVVFFPVIKWRSQRAGATVFPFYFFTLWNDPLFSLETGAIAPELLPHICLHYFMCVMTQTRGVSEAAHVPLLTVYMSGTLVVESLLWKSLCSENVIFSFYENITWDNSAQKMLM